MNDKQAEEYTSIAPSNINAERRLLSAVILNNELYELTESLTPEDFFHNGNSKIFSLINILITNSKAVDEVILMAEAEKRGLSNLVPKEYLVELVKEGININLVDYVNDIREKSILRQILKKSSFIQNKILSNDYTDATSILDLAQSELLKINTGSEKSVTFTKMSEHIAEFIDNLTERFNSDNKLTGLTTGYEDLDEKTSGLQRGDLIIVAARPSMGKTTLTLNFAENACRKADSKVAVFSMEMPKRQLVERAISSISKVDNEKIKSGDLDSADFQKIHASITTIDKMNLFIDDDAGLTPSQVRSRARKLHKEHGGLNLIIVDYLQLMNGDIKTDNKNIEVGEISKALKSLAKELDVPVIALSQLNRSLEQRPNKRPIMSDLRDSGSIEQDADLIIFIYRDEIYNEDSESKGMAEIIIGKHRNGSLGTVPLAFIGKNFRFENLSFVTQRPY